MRRTLSIAALAAAAALVQAAPRHAAAHPAAAEVRLAANQRARAHDLSLRHEQASTARDLQPAGSRGPTPAWSIRHRGANPVHGTVRR